MIWMKDIPLFAVVILQSADMTKDMQQEAIDIMMTAMDKFTSTKNNEVETVKYTHGMPSSHVTLNRLLGCCAAYQELPGQEIRDAMALCDR